MTNSKIGSEKPNYPHRISSRRRHHVLRMERKRLIPHISKSDWSSLHPSLRASGVSVPVIKPPSIIFSLPLPLPLRKSLRHSTSLMKGNQPVLAQLHHHGVQLEGVNSSFINHHPVKQVHPIPRLSHHLPLPPNNLHHHHLHQHQMLSTHRPTTKPPPPPPAPRPPPLLLLLHPPLPPAPISFAAALDHLPARPRRNDMFPSRP